MVQKKFRIKSKKAMDNMTSNIIKNYSALYSPKVDAKENITLDEIETNTGGIVTDLQPEDKIYMEKVVSGESGARATNMHSIQSLLLQSVLKLLIQTSYQYFLSETEYDLSNHFIIDENSKSYLDGEFYQIVIPHTRTKSSTKVIRFTRLNGVRMEYTAPNLTINPLNSIRVNIAIENNDGSVAELQDLIYTGEYVDIFISYSGLNKLENATILTRIPRLKVTSTIGKSTEDFKSLQFGVPASQLFECYNITETFEYNYVLISEIGLISERNPFRRSLPANVSNTWIDFTLPIKNGTALDTEFLCSPYMGESHLIRDKSNDIVCIAPLGGHFPRFQQLKDNYVSWDNTTDPDNPVMVTGDVNNIFYSDTTENHTHSYEKPSSHKVDAASQTYTSDSVMGTYSTGYNSGKRHYETAGRWVGLQAWIYL